jgi:hypothetical protein
MGRRVDELTLASRDTNDEIRDTLRDRRGRGGEAETLNARFQLPDSRATEGTEAAERGSNAKYPIEIAKFQGEPQMNADERG